MYEIIENKNSLTYPVQIGDQKIVLPDNSIFKKLGLVDLEHFYQTRIDEIKEEYIKLISDYEINKRIYSSNFKFEPVIGNVYHLYSNMFGEEFLSLISPKYWNMKYRGSYKLTSSKRWVIQD